MKKRTFIVEGMGRFPLDMLRQDECWPATEADVKNIGHRELNHRKVCVCTYNKEGLAIDRWRSFLWKVVEEVG